MNEIKDYKNTYQTQIKIEKENANREAKTMMNVIMQNQKISNYAVCYDKKLLNFKDKDYSRSICYKYYGNYVLIINK